MPLLILLIFQLADILTTIWGSFHGFGEGNPLTHSVVMLVLIKIMNLGALTPLWFVIPHQLKRWVSPMLYLAAGATGWVAVQNLLLFIGK